MARTSPAVPEKPVKSGTSGNHKLHQSAAGIGVWKLGDLMFVKRDSANGQFEIPAYVAILNRSVTYAALGAARKRDRST